MTTIPDPGLGEASTALRIAEERLRALHALRVEARLQPAFEPAYVEFVRALRERLHPRGIRDVRTVTLADGLSFQVDLGDRLGCDVYYGYYDERFEASLFAALLQPGETMLDVGANFGYYAALCARMVGPAGAVHAFEPDPAAFALLAANARENGLGGWLACHPCAVGDGDREVTYQLAEEPAFSGLDATGRAAPRGVTTVPLRSLDSFAAEHAVHDLGGLKIDVEGHEAGVLRGARDLLHRASDPLVMLEVSGKNLSAERRAALTAGLGALYAAGYTGFLPDLGPTTGAGDGLRTVGTPAEAAALPGANLLLARRGGERERRLRAEVGARLAATRQVVETAPILDVAATDADPRPVRLFAGLDPDLVGAALRDKAEAEARAAALAAEADELHVEIARLRAERAALRADVRRLGGTPLGLAVRAVRRAARALRR